MADEKVRYVLDVDDKGSPKLIKFGDNAKSAGKRAETAFDKAGKSVAQFGEQIGPGTLAGFITDSGLRPRYPAIEIYRVDIEDGRIVIGIGR